jgi:uncharacterized protein
MNHASSVTALWRYPVKSMQGEELNATAVHKAGLVGDRGYALLDTSSGKVASAKNPRKWPDLFSYRASFTAAPEANGHLPAVRITLPDGRIVASDRNDIDRVMSEALGRDVTLRARELALQEPESSAFNPWKPTLEEYWPDIEGLSNRDVITDEAMPEGTYFDCATIHLLTTSTLNRLRALYPQGRFEARRFRPNIVVATAGDGFVENDWIGRTLAIGDEVRLEVSGRCPRCIMTTLAQSDLPSDPGILRAAAQHNDAAVGVYASVVQGGRIRRGDRLLLE